MKKRLLALVIIASLATCMVSESAFAFGGIFGDIFFQTEAETEEAEPAISGIGGIGGGADNLGFPPKDEEEETEQFRAIALDDLNISVWADEFVSVREDDGFVYVYTMKDSSIPYVIIGEYDIAFNSVVNAFTRLMQSAYKDLDVDFLQEGLEIGGRKYTKVIYRYTISGYDAVDTRLFCEINGHSYMFGMKEIEELNMLVGEDFLESVAESAAILAGGYSNYLYHVDADNALFFEDVVVEPETEPATEATTEAQTVPADDRYVFDEDDAPYDGIWVPFEDGFQLFLPVDWTMYDLTNAQQQAGYLFIAGDDSEPVIPYISVSWAYDENMTDLEDLSDFLDENGYIVDETAMVNDIECVIYHAPDGSVFGELFLYPGEGFDGYLFSVVATNYEIADEAFDSMLFSLSLSE